MNPRLMTLEQMEEREANRIAFQKSKAESAIAKLSKRVEGTKDKNEIARLNKIIQTHSGYKAELEVADVATFALTKYTAIQSKLTATGIKTQPIIESEQIK